MGVLANHVPSIEQLQPGVVEIIEENGGVKQFFRTFAHFNSMAVLRPWHVRGLHIRYQPHLKEHA